jgi:hypothetical protein
MPEDRAVSALRRAAKEASSRVAEHEARDGEPDAGSQRRADLVRESSTAGARLAAAETRRRPADARKRPAGGGGAS